MRALVTGSAGFVGSHFTRELRESGWDVTTLDIALGPQQDARLWFRHRIDYFDLVVHCAAIVGGRARIEGDPLSLSANLEIDAGLFQWARRVACGRIVYFSSSAAYPVGYQKAAAHKELAEDIIGLEATGGVGKPDALYGWSKIFGEILAGLAREEGVPVTVVRPFSGYGSDQDESYPFPAMIDRALRREDPFDVWGDGRQVRDFIHIDDIVAAVLHMVSNGIDGPVNLGTGIPVSMNDLARRVCAQAGYEPRIRHLRGQPSGVAWRVADPRRMLTFYQPAVSLDDGISMALADRKLYIRPRDVVS